MPPSKKGDIAGVLGAKLDMFKEHIDNHMTAVGVKLEKLDGRLDNMDITVAKQQTILEEHVRRTNLLEEKLEKDINGVEDKIEPIKVHVSQVKLLLKILGIVIGGSAAAGGAGWGIKELIALFTG